MNLIEFENKLDDMVFDINAEIKVLDPDNGDDDQINSLIEIRDEVGKTLSALYQYKSKLTKQLKQTS